MLRPLKHTNAAAKRLSTSSKSFKNPNIEISSLSNGLRIVTDSTPGHFSALGFYVDAGARYENPLKPGLSHIFDRMAWKSTQKYSGVEMMENLAKVGGNYMCSAQRESMYYQSTVFNNDLDKMFDYMAQTVRYPKITDLEVAETLQTAAFEVSTLVDKHEVLLPEVLHAAAYKDNTLGLPLFCPMERIPQIQTEDVVAYHKKFYQPHGTVLAMVGVDHEKAVKLAEQHLSDWTNSPNSSSSSVKNLAQINFTGGVIDLPYRPPITQQLPELYHMQIGFETSGLLDDDLYSLALLQKLLGGGSSFSAGGPGKGMFSRLYTRVLNRYAFVENCSAFNHSYVGSGLFGITLSVSPQYGHVMAQIICQELADLLVVSPESGGISNTEFKRAKNQLVSSLLMNAESRLSKLDDIGRQVQCLGKITSIEEMVAKIESLSIEDVRGVMKKVLSGESKTAGMSSGKAAVAIQGDINAIGDVQEVLSYFQLGK